MNFQLTFPCISEGIQTDIQFSCRMLLFVVMLARNVRYYMYTVIRNETLRKTGSWVFSNSTYVLNNILNVLRLEDTYGAKIRPSLHFSLNNFVIRPSFKNLRDNVFDQMAKDVKSLFTFSR